MPLPERQQNFIKKPLISRNCRYLCRNNGKTIGPMAALLAI
jgi:hypothetical protein